ncbi:tripartite tricarboxylate transporter TctB family protein [Ahrensia sp. R2A130]|uniref:tripartite tricarboxylate transporter TctB family protein n=1 Tax=Ahrensia sp. R2A130 TaxID=744979 RepID=UPI0001E0E91C|nr:tripartite tricarboxylate transporter TctB family protein [Ahrensia sp. R2A130]EFL87491.1 trap-t family transporter fused small and large inner membrane subunits [Ahrensia sp. R2A130]
MLDGDKRQGGARTGSLLISSFFVVAGIVVLWDTQSYSDSDSQVFPQTVAIVLIICATISLLTSWLKGESEGGFGEGIWWRRVLLVASLLLACFLMPYIGFLLAGIVAFAGGLIAAMHDRWTITKALLYGGSGLVVMTAFYTLFRYVLLVPLP